MARLRTHVLQARGCVREFVNEEVLRSIRKARRPHRSYSDLCGCELLNEHHGIGAFWTGPRSTVRGGSFLRRCSHVHQKLAAQRNQFSSSPIREQAKVPDACKPAWEDMHEESAQKLFGRESHLPLLASVSVVFPMKGDLVSPIRNQPVIRDRYTVCIPRQIL